MTSLRPDGACPSGRGKVWIVTAIAKTIEIQDEIDALYPDVENDVLLVEASRGTEGQT